MEYKEPGTGQARYSRKPYYNSGEERRDFVNDRQLDLKSRHINVKSLRFWKEHVGV